MQADPRSHSLADRAGQAFAAYRSGDVDRMSELVEILTPLLWHTARSQRLDEGSAHDVVQTAWLRLVENADRIADPQAVMGWLLVTVRRESWRLSRRDARVDGELDETAEDPAPGPDALTVLHEGDQSLWQHLMALTPRCQALLRVIAFADRPDYAAVSEALGMPVGSIGPTRGRCLAKLREALLADPTWGGPGGAAR